MNPGSLLSSSPVGTGRSTIAGGIFLDVLALDDAARDPSDPVVRYRGTVRAPVAAGGSWVVVAAHGRELEPVFPRRMAFAVSNPVFLRR